MCAARIPDHTQDASSGDHFWAEDGKTMQRYVQGFASASRKAQQDKSVVIVDNSQSMFSFYISSGAKASHMGAQNCADG